MLRVTFVTPHQDETAGGVYAIQKLAQHLAHRFDVRLVVRWGRTRAIPGVQVTRSERIRTDEAGSADLLVLYSDIHDLGDLRLDPALGRPLLYHQGYITPDDPLIAANLRTGYPVLASSQWLTSDARAHGCETYYVPYGLDRTIFAQNTSRFVRRDPNLVAMMTHRFEVKGTLDGLVALRQVVHQRPATRLLLFGASGAELPEPFESVGDGTIVGTLRTHVRRIVTRRRERADGVPVTLVSRPPRQRVAEIFQRAAVFVCSSWQEGFGMPGLEALACGAALATTDTKGSRDYALDGQTALVSPPREPGLLALNVLRLLEDEVGRASQASAAAKLLNERFPSWDIAAERFGDIVAGMARR